MLMLDAAGQLSGSLYLPVLHCIKTCQGNCDADAAVMSRKPQAPSHEDGAFFKERERTDDMMTWLIGKGDEIGDKVISTLCQGYFVAFKGPSHRPRIDCCCIISRVKLIETIMSQCVQFCFSCFPTLLCFSLPVFK